MENMKRFTILLLILLFSTNSVFAVEVTPRANLSIDSSIIKEDLSYALPTEIVIAPIFLQSNIKRLSLKDWYRAVYYYTIEKLGFTDIPFHYIVTENGEVFQGNIGGDERKVNVDNIGESIILIGYLSYSSKTEFSTKALNSIKELLSTTANKNSIPSNKVIASGLKFVRDEENKTVRMQSVEVFGNWQSQMDGLRAYVSENYAPVPKTYSAEMKNLVISADQVEPGDTITGNITIANTGTNGFYGGSENEIVVTRAGNSNSQFFINGTWLSRSQFGIMLDNQNILPSQELSFEFKLQAPLTVGEVSETFELRTIGGQGVQSNALTLTLNMKRSSRRIIQIQNTELGYLKVRGEPSTVGPEIDQAASGERYFVIEDAGNGYLKIDLKNGKTGWVAGWLVNDI